MSDRTAIEDIGRKRSRRSFRLWIAILAVIAVAGGAWFLFARGDGDGAVSYTTDAATVADIIVTVTATGTIEPVNTVEVSSELSGIVRTVSADYNDVVKRGDVLAELDTDKLEASVEHARATLTARNANLVEAEVTLAERKDAYDRAVQLFDRGISAEDVLLTARAAYQRAEAAVDTAKANIAVAAADVRLAETNLEKSRIGSPIDGIVLDRTVEVGQIVAASLSAPTLFTLAEDLASMNLTVDIDEADIGQVASGNPATFTVEAYRGRSFEASIVQLRYAPETIEGVITYKAILDVDNDDLLLRPGMTATAEITVAELKDVLTVSNAALRFAPPAAQREGEGGRGLLGMLIPRPPEQTRGPVRGADADGMRPIWVLRDGELAPVSVRTGQTDRSRTEIVEGGLEPGDAVVTDLSGTS